MVARRKARAIREGICEARRDVEYIFRLVGTRQEILSAYRAIQPRRIVHTLDLMVASLVYAGAVAFVFLTMPHPFSAYGQAWRRAAVPLLKAGLAERTD